MNLGAVQADGAKARELILPRHLQHLHKGGLKFLAKALPEGRQGVVTGCRLQAIYRNANESKVARSILRLEKVPVA